jgi:hypothetical protein
MSEQNDSVINKLVNNLPFEMHAWSPEVGKYAACGPGSKTQERLDQYIKTGDTNHIFKNELDKACLYHDVAYGSNKDVPSRHIADKELMDRAIAIASDKTKNGYERALSSLLYKFFEKKIKMGQGIQSDNAVLADELHHPIRHNYPRRKVKATNVDEIWACDLVDMTEVNADNGYRYILNIVDCFSKYAWSVPLKSKRTEELVEAFRTLFRTSKPERLWWDEESGIHSNKFQTFLMNENVALYTTGSEIGVSVVERFNRTLKNWMWKEFTKNGNKKWLNILPTLIDKYNNKKHSTIKMTPVDARKKQNYSTVYNRINNDNRKATKPLLQIGDRVRIYKWKSEVGKKGYTPNWSKEIFVVGDVVSSNPVTYYIKDLNGEYIVVPNQNKPAGFYEQQLLKSQL